VGRADGLLQSPYPSSTQSVDPAIARGRRLNLPREIWQEPEVSRGQNRPAVGEANEALQVERRSKRIGRTGNEERRPKRERSGK
jgi:hypothetical protein